MVIPDETRRAAIRASRWTIIPAATLCTVGCGVAPVWAFGGGGTAPGGPLSGSVRPACNGYKMDGTIDMSPDATRPGCIDRSVDTTRGSSSESSRRR